MNAQAENKERVSMDQIQKEMREEEAKAKAYWESNGYGLKGLKVFLAGSKETTCFQADITKNGKVIGHAENDGWGGSTNVQVDYNVHDGSLLETHIDVLVDAEVNRKELDKQIKSMTKKGYDYVLVGETVVMGDYGDKDKVVADFTKKYGAPIQVVDLTATSAATRKALDEAKNAKWKENIKVKYRNNGAGAVLFWTNEKGGISAKGFVTPREAQVYAKGVKDTNAEVVLL